MCVAHDVSAGSSGAALAKNGVWNRDESHNANADILHAFASMHHDQAVGLKTGKGMLASEDYKPRCEIAPRERIREVVEGNSVSYPRKNSGSSCAMDGIRLHRCHEMGLLTCRCK